MVSARFVHVPAKCLCVGQICWSCLLYQVLSAGCVGPLLASDAACSSMGTERRFRRSCGPSLRCARLARTSSITSRFISPQGVDFVGCVRPTSFKTWPNPGSIWPDIWRLGRLLDRIRQWVGRCRPMLGRCPQHSGASSGDARPGLGCRLGSAQARD